MNTIELIDSLYMEKTALSAGDIMGGLLGAAHRQYQQGNITGRETMYHGTDKANIPSIQDQGILRSKANDPESFTRKILLKGKSSVNPDDLNDLVYLGKSKGLSKNVAMNSWGHRNLGHSPISEYEMARAAKNTGVVKVRAPQGAFKEIPNPELRGTKTDREFARKIIQEADTPKFAKPIVNPLVHLLAKGSQKSLGKQTATIPEDIPTKWIKGSKDYVKTTPKEVARFAAKNPGRFAKGIAPGVAAAGLTAAEILSLLRKAR